MYEFVDLFFLEIVELVCEYGWVFDDYFSVDGMLIEVWVLMKSFWFKDD